MTNVDIFYLVLGLALIAWAGRWAYRRHHYRSAMAQPFPDAWQQMLITRLPVYERLPAALKQELQAHIQHFLYTKQFVGCNGQDITDEVRVVIAAEACLLILNRASTRYKNLRWIYVYPSTFIAKREQQDAYGVVSESKTHMLGESWSNGRVILAWDSVERGMYNFSDGRNVVLHEFAHQLDQEDGAADGAPLLYTRDSYQIWAQVFSQEFTQLQAKLARGGNSLIDSYGATNPAEFFAVVTELFYERPAQMRKRHPELFKALQGYYRLDPEAWQKP